MKLPNRNQVLIVIGLLAVEGPDVAAVATWLSGLGIPRLIGVVHFLGFLSAALGGLALAWPRIRAILAAGGLATPPGAVAPWNPARDAGPAAAPCSLPPGPRPSSAGPMGNDRPGSRYDKGSAGLVQLLILAIIAAAMVTLLALPARAQSPAPSPVSPQLGGCFDNGLFCAGLAAQASVTKVGLSSGNKGITGGFSTGVGYGLTLAQDKWYASGIDLFINVNSSSSQLSTLPQASNSRVSPMLMLNLLNYLFVGFGADVTAPSDPAGSYSTGWYMTFGFGSTLNTITAGYAKQEAARQVAAEKAKADGK
jgi:hypothetical protein